VQLRGFSQNGILPILHEDVENAVILTSLHPKKDFPDLGKAAPPASFVSRTPSTVPQNRILPFLHETAKGTSELLLFTCRGIGRVRTPHDHIRMTRRELISRCRRSGNRWMEKWFLFFQRIADEHQEANFQI
jgi:hypothetical protein